MNDRSRIWILGFVALGLAATVVAMLLAAPQLVRAATITVGGGGDHATIQAAIDAANPGDVIQVRNELFYEDLIITKSLTLEGSYAAGFGSRTNPGTMTVISGTATNSVISITGSSLIVTVDGFEIKEGYVGNPWEAGAGILIDVDTDAEVVIHDNYLHDNHADNNGGAIWADVENRSELVITNNRVVTNTAGNSGGGIWADLFYSCTLTLQDNWIENNYAANDFGGLYALVQAFGTYAVLSNTLVLNDADSMAGGLWFRARDLVEGSFDHNDVLTNTAGTAGGAYIEIDHQASATFHDNEFRDNQTDDSDVGGLELVVDDKSTLTGSDLVLKDNHSVDDLGGGVVRVKDHSTAELDGVDVVGNSAEGDFGGILFDLGYDDGDNGQSGGRHSNLVVKDLYVVDNQVAKDYGGVGFAVADNSSIQARSSRIISNTADEGGGAFADIENNSSLDLSGSSVFSNTALDDGGGLYLEDNANSSSLNLDNTKFMTNTAGEFGGAIHVDSDDDGEMARHDSSVSIQGAEFISNTAQTYSGGAIWAEGALASDGSTAILSDTLFLRNLAVGSDDDGEAGGGAIWSGSDLSADGSQVTIQSCRFISNTTSEGYGGAVYADGDGADDGSTLTIRDTKFYSNTAWQSGGALYIGEDTGSALAREGSTTIIQDNEFYTNTSRSGSGGAIRTSVGAYQGAILRLQGNRFRNNEADSRGGAIYIKEWDEDDAGGLADRGSSAYVTENWVEGNRALNDGDSSGGGLYLGRVSRGSYAEILSNTVKANISSGRGAGLRLQQINDGSALEFVGNIIAGNIVSTQESYDGGGVYIQSVRNGSMLRMTNNVITGNVATDDGGGLYLSYFDDDDYENTISDGSVFYFESNDLSENEAGGEGGGCKFAGEMRDGASFYFNYNEVNDNVAAGSDDGNWGGGGCMLRSGFMEANVVEFKGNKFQRNVSAADYGGLYVGSVNAATSVLFEANYVVDNKAGYSGTVATGGDGGGIYLDYSEPEDDDPEGGSTIDIRDNLIMTNTAYRAGGEGGDHGGLYVAAYTGAKVQIEDNTIKHNEAQNRYGGVTVVLTDARLTMEHNLIEANRATTDTAGLAIYASQGYNQYFLLRNRIISNVANPAFCGGLRIRDAGTELWGESSNNLIAGNTGDGVSLINAGWFGPNDTIADNSDRAFAFAGSVPSTITLLNDIVWGNTGGVLQQAGSVASWKVDYSNIQGAAPPGDSNMSQDPEFVGGDDYHLQSNSPVIGQADTSRAPAVDLDNVPRPVGDDADMGCYEYYTTSVALASTQAGTGAPGEVAGYDLTITRYGDTADSFAFDVPENSQGWPVAVQPETLDLGPMESKAVRVEVTVPEGAGAGTLNQVTVRATSQTDGQVLDTVELATEAVLVSAVALDPNGAQTAPAGEVTYEHVLHNLSNGAESFRLAAASDQGWTVIVYPAVAHLARGETSTVQVTVRVPEAAAAGAIDVTTLTAISLSDESVSASATDTTTREAGPAAAYTLFLPVITRNR